eukprot:3134388-Prymnesium_polylepis.2
MLLALDHGAPEHVLRIIAGTPCTPPAAAAAAAAHTTCGWHAAWHTAWRTDYRAMASAESSPPACRSLAHPAGSERCPDEGFEYRVVWSPGLRVRRTPSLSADVVRLLRVGELVRGRPPEGTSGGTCGGW